MENITFFKIIAHTKKFLILIFFIFTPLIQAAAVSVTVLQNKENAEKYIILVADQHRFYKQVEDTQIMFITDLLQLAKQYPLKKNSIEFIFECPQVRIQEYQSAELKIVGDVFDYILSLYTLNQLPDEIKFIPCDIRTQHDVFAYDILEDLFNVTALTGFEKGKLHSYEALIKAGNDIMRNPQPGQVIINKRPLYDLYVEHPEQVQKSFYVTIGQYLKRLDELQDVVNRKSAHLPDRYRKFFMEKLSQSVSEAKSIINSYGLPNTAKNTDFASKVIQKNPNLLDEWQQLNKLQMPSEAASDLDMLNSIFESQKKVNVTFFYGGTSHILRMLEVLEADYKVVNAFDLVAQIESTSGTELNFYGKAQLLEMVKRIGQTIGLP